MKAQNYPEFLIAIPRCLQLSIDLHSIPRDSYVKLINCNEDESASLFYVQSNAIPRLTEKIGGTEASLPVSFASVVTGMITSACGAVGCFADDSKNVADRVAIHQSDANPQTH